MDELVTDGAWVYIVMDMVGWVGAGLEVVDGIACGTRPAGLVT